MLPFIVETDASMEGLGAVLSQKQNGQTVVIAYASRRLKKHEQSMRNFNSCILELLAKTWAIAKKFKDYLCGAKFTLLMDNNPLTHVMDSKKSTVEMGWLADLANYDFDIKYHSGMSNVIADVLCRHPVNDRSVLPSEEVHVMLDGVMQCSTLPDELTAGVVPLLVEGVFTLTASLLDTDRSTFLPSYLPKDIQELQEGDVVISRVLTFLRNESKPSNSDIAREPVDAQNMFCKFSQFHVFDCISFKLCGEEV